MAPASRAATANGSKGPQRVIGIDRLATYRMWRWGLGFGAATDVDFIEWAGDAPAALLELSRVDGNVRVPDSYLRAVLERITVRDTQGRRSRAIAAACGVHAWLVLFRWDMSEFWIYNLSTSHGWWHGDAEKYRQWLRRIGTVPPLVLHP